MVPTSWYVGLSAVLFVIGVLGVLVRRNPLVIFMSIEIMLNAANLAFVAFGQHHGSVDGQALVFFVLCVAAAEVAVGLAIIVAIFRLRRRLSVAELFGRMDGLSKGKGGSMHLFDKSVNFLGGHGIVGAHLPLAAGAGFGIKYQGGDQVVLCFFGDGAVPEGEFHESLNLAALWKLPVLFICENNRYAMGTAIHRALAQTEIWRFAETYGIHGEPVDGMDVLAIRECVGRAVERARRDKSPALIEVRTYRFRGHSMRDPAGAVYRTKEEVEREKLRDPITLFRDKAIKAGWLSEADVRAIEKDVSDRIDDAVAFADASPEPPVEWLLTDIYKED